jgi:hypothetical protein
MLRKNLKLEFLILLPFFKIGNIFVGSDSIDLSFPCNLNKIFDDPFVWKILLKSENHCIKVTFPVNFPKFIFENGGLMLSNVHAYS